MKNLSIALALLVLLAIGVVVVRVTRRAPPPVARPNLVLVTIDTLRADRLQRGLTPALDALGDTGRRFTHARTVVPLTLPSHATILTGRLPAEHGVRQNGQRLASTVPTMAQRLHDAGYRTGAFVGAYVLDRRFGLAAGFDHYDDHVERQGGASVRLEAERRGSEVIDAAIGWLAGASSPFFLWVHLYDPHAPYDPPAEYLSRGAGNSYDGEVAYADAQVGRLIETLRSRGLLAQTVVAVTGDHGEGLGEHREDTHGMLAYDSTLRVPLLITGPGIAPRTENAPVSLVDLSSSLLRRAGVPEHAGADHPDLLGRLDVERDHYAETTYPRVAGWHPLSVLVGEQWKLVMSGRPELYDIGADPAELQDVAGRRPAVVEGMVARLRQVGAGSQAAAPTVSAEAAERLRALGYVAPSASASAASDSGAANPAAMIAAWGDFERALALVNAGRVNQALAPLAVLAERFPDAPLFQSTYGRALKDAGRADDAVRVYRQTVQRWPDDPGLFHDLAVAARMAGDAAEALRAERAALALDATSPAALNGGALLLVEAGEISEALPMFEKAAAADPSNASYWTNLGNAQRAAGDLAAAERAYRRGLEADPGYADAANGLGVLLVQQGSASGAIQWFELALRRAPAHYEARLNLGIAYQETGQRDKAVEAYRAVLAAAPPDALRERQAATALLDQLK